MFSSASCQTSTPFNIGNPGNGRGQLQSESVMAARFSTREVFMLTIILGFLMVRAVRIKAKTFMLTAENTVLVAWTSKAFRK